MASFSKHTGSTVGATGVSGYGVSSIWGGHSPGRYMRAGKSYIPGNTWASDRSPMDRGYGRLFEGAKDDGSDRIASFEEFMAIQKNPDRLVNAVVQKNSPDFLLAQMKFN